MKETPILLTPGNINASRREHSPKTRTRRVVKGAALQNLTTQERWSFLNIDKEHLLDPYNKYSPYGYIADKLWVRESWRALSPYDGVKPSELPEDTIIYYEADSLFGEKAMWLAPPEEKGSVWGKKRPSIFMPRWACRYHLTIENIDIRRLQDITEEEAIQEGIDHLGNGLYKNYMAGTGWEWHSNKGDPELGGSPVMSFASLWDSINGKAKLNGNPIDWDANPWVWDIEYRLKPAGEIW